MNIAIIGYGFVGKATGYFLNITYNFDQPVEKYTDVQIKGYMERCDLYIICVPTPTINGKQDISAIVEWVRKIKQVNVDAKIVIRSTILPGTTDALSKE